MAKTNSSVKNTEIEKILSSDRDAVQKVRAIVSLGYDEDAADEMVTHYQLGEELVDYYERLYYFDETVEPR